MFSIGNNKIYIVRNPICISEKYHNYIVDEIIRWYKMDFYIQIEIDHDSDGNHK